jgi:hypothetical protein
LTGQIVGVPLVDIPANNYGWLCIKGRVPAVVDTGDTLVRGEPAGYPATIAVAGAFGVPAITDPIVGVTVYEATASEYGCVALDLT